MPTQSQARVARLLAVLVLLMTCSLATAGPASAGGPTSVILVAPGFQRVAAMYNSDSDYQRLETLLAVPADAGTVESNPPTMPTAAGSGYITVTWLIHDVSVWRIDRIFLAKNGNHLIVTQMMDGTTSGAEGMYPGQTGSASAVIHSPTDPVALQALLDKVGLTTPAQRASGDVPVSTAPDPRMEVASIAEPAGSAAGAWWILAGLALGAIATAIAFRYLPAVRRGVVGDADRPSAEPVQMIRL